MSKNRLTKSDFFAVYAILISLSIFMIGFFLGAKVGQNKAEENFEQYVQQFDPQDSKSGQLQYSHTDFVTYYYNAYLPFKAFRKEYLNQYHQLAREDSLQTVQKNLKELQKLASDVQEEIQNANFPESSPLLHSSIEEYIFALQAIKEGLSTLSTLDGSVELVITGWTESKPFSTGHQHWLTAQTRFYEALVAWNHLYVEQTTPQFIDHPQSYTLRQWEDLGFHQKNELVAKILEANGILSYFNPEDVQVYLDTYASQQTSSVPIQTVQDAIEFLVASNSIRQEEFIEHYSDYAPVDSPPIPLFVNE